MCLCQCCHDWLYQSNSIQHRSRNYPGKGGLSPDADQEWMTTNLCIRLKGWFGISLVPGYLVIFDDGLIRIVKV